MTVRLKTLIARWEENEGRELTYEELAARANLHRNTVSSLARGDAKRIDFETIRKLCDFFDCSTSELIEYSKSSDKAS